MNCPKTLTNGHISLTKQLGFTRDFSSPRPSPPKHQSAHFRAFGCRFSVRKHKNTRFRAFEDRFQWRKHKNA